MLPCFRSGEMGQAEDDIILFLTVATELLETIPSNITKNFITKALENTHISTLIPPEIHSNRHPEIIQDGIYGNKNNYS